MRWLEDKVESVIFLHAGLEVEVTDSLLSIHRQLERMK